MDAPSRLDTEVEDDNTPPTELAYVSHHLEVSVTLIVNRPPFSSPQVVPVSQTVRNVAAVQEETPLLSSR